MATEARGRHEFRYDSNDAPDALVRDFLSSLEQEESRLLTWGVVDGGFSLEDVADRAESFVAESNASGDVDPAGLVDTLLRRRLIFDLPMDGRRLYRTRMAESVRLFSRLRQLFPGKDWRSGANLVSDFRFTLRPRVYPRRDVTIEKAMTSWATAEILKPGRREALAELLKYPGLAGFQVRATERMFRDIDSPWARGMIVTVGTGSGKTLAFYLPALSHIATLIKADEHWTKVVAMYPRNELLKDQFSDCYNEARRLDELLMAQGRRKITVGAFFGPTPNRATIDDVEKKQWLKRGDGFICPYLRCPTKGCEGALIWSAADLTGGVERLRCSECASILAADTVLLTRNRLKQQPPDVLFTTTEMLNRVMGDSYNRHVFGIGATKSPQIVLLDEVHTYEGTHGAQVALLMRRWRHAVRTRMQFTGLSATLRNAPEFFAQLIGLKAHAVEEITPVPAELEREGMEYLLALRGDPVSKTSLLSTTIQATMLLRRVLDPNQDGQQGGNGAVTSRWYGKKVFVFTDDLDVTNRLYHNLLDAEGLNSWGKPKPNGKPLAALRARGGIDNSARLTAGQSWYLCEEIGHPEGLAIPMRIGRTSSQDTGVDQASDAIVATASLEVGYNDPEVGAVLQHKAPQNAASFLQRKGRAGRLRTMRPWTVVVLSDYGRDRLAYQGYDSLFDPTLIPRSLPVANRYVLRMQAVFVFMDWLALQLPESPRGSVYSDLTGPGWNQGVKERQKAEAEIVRRVLAQGDPLQDSLARYLASSLHVTANEAASLMWDPPRALMTHVLPTVLRRLEAGWQRVQLEEKEPSLDYQVPMHPMPDFVPGNLFSDLNLPEVTITTPAPEGRSDALPIVQALRSLAPGKVTRRFAVGNAYTSHWIQPVNLTPGMSDQDMEVESICEEFEEVGVFQARINGDTVVDIRCVRPWALRPTIVPNNIKVTSNSFLEWRSQLVPAGTPVSLDLPEQTEIAELIDGMHFYGHAFRSHVEARRFAINTQASVGLKSGQEVRARIRFIDRSTQQQSSVGFAAAVDGLKVTIRKADDLIIAGDPNSEKVRAFRTSYFRHCVLTDIELNKYANTFQLEWLWQAYSSTLCAWSVAESTTLEIANEALIAGTVERAVAKVLNVIFETLNAEDRNDETGDETAGAQGKLREDVMSLFGEDTVLARLKDLARVLWSPPDAGWHSWARDRYLATLGGAIVEACAQLYPEASADDLLVDFDPGPSPTGAPASDETHDEIWITEMTLGGAGVLEEVARRQAEDPRRFFRLIESALGPSDYELVDAELTRILEMIPIDTALSDLLETVRAASRHADLQRAVSMLEAGLAARGVSVTHPVMSAVYARILRPGSGPHTDALLLNLILRWRAEEQRLGVELDARVFAYLASGYTDVTESLQQVDPMVSEARASRFHAIYALLWPRGNTVRSIALGTYNPFTSLPPSDRELVLDRLIQSCPAIEVTDEGWREAAAVELRKGGSVHLKASLSAASILKEALLSFGSEPLEVDALLLYTHVEGIERGPTGFRARIYLDEAIQ